MNREDVLKNSKCFLNGHPKKPPAEILLSLSENLPEDLQADFYGSKKLIEDFEKKMADFLGFPSAVFMPSGTMAQNIALRIWSDRKKNKKVGFHPLSHLEVHEFHAYRELHGLESVLIGAPDQILTFKDLQNAPPLSSLLLELPQRDLGGVLPSWEELERISHWAREQKIALHLDGARLWESQPFYQKTYKEITALFDSVYVSYYKGLGGMAGAILAGDEDFISRAKIWQRRQGGNLITLFPYLLSADKNFDLRISKMEAYHKKAQEVAKLLVAYPKVTMRPHPPHTNMIHLFIEAPLERLNELSIEVAQKTGLYLFHAFKLHPSANTPFTELTMGDYSLSLSHEELKKNLDLFFNSL